MPTMQISCMQMMMTMMMMDDDDDEEEEEDDDDDNDDDDDDDDTAEYVIHETDEGLRKDLTNCLLNLSEPRNMEPSSMYFWMKC